MDIQVILSLIVINVLLYYKTTKYGGICDDIPVFNQKVEIPKNKWMYFWYHLHGRKYVSWKLAHWQVIGIHSLNCILVYYAFGQSPVSLIASLLFAVNPVNNQCSIWISGKGYSMNTTCALLMWMFPAYSVIPYLFGTYFCGASLVLFPLIFLFTPYWWLSALVLLGLYREKDRIFNKKDPRSKFNTESNKELKALKPRKLILFFKTYAYHFVNALSARKLGLYHKYMFLMGVNPKENKKSYKIDGYFFLGILIILITLYTRNIYMMWFSISILQWCNLISFNQTIASRYVYMANVGLMYLLATLIAPYPFLVVGFLVYYTTKLIFFMKAYDNEYWSIEYACWEQPNFFYSWQNRAAHCFLNRNYHGALGNTIKAMELRPDDWKLTYNLVQIYMILGHLPLAKQTYEKALKLNIDGREEQIGNLMKRLGGWLADIEKQAKENGNKVDIDLLKFDMQR